MDVRYEKIRKTFGGLDAVTDLDLHVPDGSFLALLGPSGCGKTTALRILAGLEEPTSGRVFIGPRDVTDLQPKDRDVAMVFQSYALYPHKNVAENIAYPLRVRKVAKEQRTARAAEVARMLDIDALLDRTPRQLSGGQRQRVALARAIVREPQAFLMDEPLSNLDAKLRGQMRAEIRSLQREYKTTTLYVTHDQVEAMTMGDRIAVLRKGVLQQLGTPEELYEAPANLFVAEFLGSPPMNIVRATVTRSAAGPQLVVGSQRLQLAEGALDAFPALAGGDATPVALGLRPECLQDSATADPRWPRLVADVDVVEKVPPEKLVHLRLDAEAVVTEATLEIAQDTDEAAADELRQLGKGAALQARLPGSSTVREGTRAEFAIAPTALHFFDLASGEAIGSGRSLAGAAR